MLVMYVEERIKLLGKPLHTWTLISIIIIVQKCNYQLPSPSCSDKRIDLLSNNNNNIDDNNIDDNNIDDNNNSRTTPQSVSDRFKTKGTGPRPTSRYNAPSLA